MASALASAAAVSDASSAVPAAVLAPLPAVGAGESSRRKISNTRESAIALSTHTTGVSVRIRRTCSDEFEWDTCRAVQIQIRRFPKYEVRTMYGYSRISKY